MWRRLGGCALPYSLSLPDRWLVGGGGSGHALPFTRSCRRGGCGLPRLAASSPRAGAASSCVRRRDGGGRAAPRPPPPDLVAEGATLVAERRTSAAGGGGGGGRRRCLILIFFLFFNGSLMLDDVGCVLDLGDWGWMMLDVFLILVIENLICCWMNDEMC